MLCRDPLKWQPYCKSTLHQLSWQFSVDVTGCLTTNWDSGILSSSSSLCRDSIFSHLSWTCDEEVSECNRLHFWFLLSPTYGTSSELLNFARALGFHLATNKKIYVSWLSFIVIVESSSDSGPSFGGVINISASQNSSLSTKSISSLVYYLKQNRISSTCSIPMFLYWNSLKTPRWPQLRRSLFDWLCAQQLIKCFRTPPYN